MAADARGQFARKFAALLQDSGLQAKQVVSRVRAGRPQGASWSVTDGLLSAWKTGRNLPSEPNQEGFFRVVRVLTEHARRRAARGHTVGVLLDEVTWNRLLKQARAAPPLVEPSQPDGKQSISEPSRHRVGRVPRVADCFQSRDAAAMLDRVAASSRTVVPCHVLAGMGGVGKTQLAASYAHRVWEAGDLELLVWVTASSRQQIVGTYARAASRVVPSTDPADPEAAAQRFLEWMAETSDRWLVVLDDVHRPGDLTRWWPPDRSGGQVVVTTRHRSAAWSDQGRVQVDLDLFSEAEARTYLHAKFASHPVRQTDAEIDALAADLGRLPLALAQAAVFIVNEDLDIPAYRELLAERLLAQVVPESKDLPDEQQKIVAAIWELSVDQANAARPVGLAKPLMYLESMLDPNGIPAAVLTSTPARDYLATYLPDPADLHNVPTVTEQDVVQTLRVLHRFNLIDHDRHATHQEIRVHQLIQRATRETLIHDPDLYAALADTVADALINVWPATERDRLGQILRANTTALRAATGSSLTQFGPVHIVSFVAARTLGESGQVHAAVTEYIHLGTATTRLLRSDHPITLAARKELARWRLAAGDPARAIAELEELLTDYQRILGSDHPDTLETRHYLARSRGEAGDLVGATAAAEELLADCLRVLGPDHGGTRAARGNLGLWRKAAGDLAGAIGETEKLLADSLRVLGPDHPDTLGIQGNLALFRAQVRDAADTVAEFEKLLVGQLRKLGPDHPQVLRTRSTLAILRVTAGDAVGAIAELEKLLADSLRVLGPDNPQTLTTRVNLAASRRLVGDAARAIAELEELLADKLRVLGPDHPDTLTTRKNLAQWRDEAGLT